LLQRDQIQSQAPRPAAAPPYAVPFTGTYRVDYGPQTDLDGKPLAGAPPNTVTWGVRSVCRLAGCVATASRLDGESFVSETVFDDVGGRWVAVDLR
jgi:serine/threonine-protein kinase